MKRILAVLLLLAVASLGFSVSGKVYARYKANVNDGNLTAATGFYDSEPWVKWKETPLGDLRVGRGGTGVSMNFDSFGIDYKIRRPINSAENWSGNWNLNDLATAAGSTLQANSPGYVKISGLKAGTIDLSIGGSWWTLAQSADVFATNALGATNTLAKGSVGYNMVALDLTYNIQVGDIRIHADPWNQVNFAFWTGSLDAKGIGGTNVASVGGYALVLPWEIDTSMDTLSVGIHGKLILQGANTASYTGAAAGTTNLGNTSGMYFGTVAKLNYVVNELVDVYGDIGIIINNTSSFSTTVAATNTTTGAVTEVPILAGITLKPAPVMTLNIGGGYALELGTKSTTIASSGLGATTNNSWTDSHAQNMWDLMTMHFYHKPLIKFAADTKFAGDWGAGLTFVVALNSAGMGSDASTDVQTHNDFGYSKSVEWLRFSNWANWDADGGAACYISYAKDNFEAKAIFGSKGDLLGMFSEIDFGIKY